MLDEQRAQDLVHLLVGRERIASLALAELDHAVALDGRHLGRERSERLLVGLLGLVVQHLAAHLQHDLQLVGRDLRIRQRLHQESAEGLRRRAHPS
jgi:hypothetical protein